MSRRADDAHPMPFRARFDCLWCGTAWETRAAGDLEGWAQLCPACLGKAGSNAFLRGRLRSAIAERGAAGGALPRERARPPARVARAFPGDWFLRHGAFERGAVHDAAWQAELDAVVRWLDGQPVGGRILEPAAGVGFFSPLLAGKGELHASDADAGALDQARERLVAHGLLAHLHVADPWAVTPSAEPALDGERAAGREAAADDRPGLASPGEPPADALVAAFLLGRVRGAGLDAAVAALRARLRAGGRLAVIDLRPDPAGGPPPGIPWTWHEPAVVEAALVRAGFGDVRVTRTGRFFLLASAEAA